DKTMKPTQVDVQPISRLLRYTTPTRHSGRLKSPKIKPTYFQLFGALKGRSSLAKAVSFLRALTKAKRLMPLAHVYPMAEAARIAAGLPIEISARLKTAITAMVMNGVPLRFVLPSTRGRLPSVDIECIAREDPR